MDPVDAGALAAVLRRRPRRRDRRSSTTWSRSASNLLYLTPVFPAASNHRYDAASFDRVDPLLGGDEAYVAADRGGARARHPRHRRPHEQPLRRHARVVPRGATATPARRRRSSTTSRMPRNTEYVSWLGYRACRSSTGRRRSCATGSSRARTRSSRTWLKPPFGADGWRIDVANMTGRLGAVDLQRRGAPAAARDDERHQPRRRSCSASRRTTPRATCRATAGTAR